MVDPIRVQLEQGPSKVWACALDWPGWSRSGRDRERALGSLAAAAPRYSPVALAAGYPLPADAAGALEVVATVAGGGNSQWAPSIVAAAEREPLDRAAAARRAGLVAACWAELDRIAGASPATLRRGPRGGGRDRDDVVGHVHAAEAAYVRKLGLRLAEPAVSDSAAVASFRESVLAVLRQPGAGTDLVEGGWPAAYGARRIAWHVLDHAWEIEDKAQ